jgi:NADH-quinone oxidoreductase subunit G
MRDLGPWDGERAALGDAPATRPQEDAGALRLATWKQMVDNGSMQAGEKYLRATGRRAVARVSPATYATLHDSVRDGGIVVGDRGRMSLPVEPTEGMVDGVVWVPGNSGNLGVLAVASPGSSVTLKGAEA